MPHKQLTQINIHYFQEGSLDTATEILVFTHGLRRSARAWQLVQKSLPQQYFSISVNNRGSGETDAPDDERCYGVEHFANDLFELVTTLTLPKFTLIGGSDGGATAMKFAVDHPCLIKALVLVDPTDPDGNLPVNMDLNEFINKRVASWKRLRRDIMDGKEHLIPRNTPKGFRKALLNDIISAPERRIRGSTRSMALLRIGDKVRNLAMPILLAAGDQVSLDRIHKILSKLPTNTHLEIIHRAGHALNVDAPRETALMIRRFIEGISPA